MVEEERERKSTRFETHLSTEEEGVVRTHSKDSGRRCMVSGKGVEGEERWVAVEKERKEAPVEKGVMEANLEVELSVPANLEVETK